MNRFDCVFTVRMSLVRSHTQMNRVTGTLIDIPTDVYIDVYIGMCVCSHTRMCRVTGTPTDLPRDVYTGVYVCMRVCSHTRMYHVALHVQCVMVAA